LSEHTKSELGTQTTIDSTHASTEAHDSHHEVGVWQILFESNLLNMVILAAVVIYLANKYIPKILTTRKDQISRELTKAKEAQEEAEKELEIAREKTQKLSLEIEEIKTEAKKTASAIKAGIEEDTEKEIELLKNRIRKEISNAEDEAVHSIQKSATNAAIKLAEETLIKVSQNEEVQKKLINDFVSGLKEPGKNQ